MAKRAINAREIMADIRAGMDDADLMKRYRLTPKGLDRVFRKLLKAKLISRTELVSRNAGYEQTIELDGLHAGAPKASSTRTSLQRECDYSFSGMVQGVDILDYIQFLLLHGRRTVLEIKSATGECCKLFIDDGQVLHAVCGECAGEEALYRCVQFKGGEFVQLSWTKPEQITVRKMGMSLLLEAARRRDELDADKTPMKS